MERREMNIPTKTTDKPKPVMDKWVKKDREIQIAQCFNLAHEDILKGNYVLAKPFESTTWKTEDAKQFDIDNIKELTRRYDKALTELKEELVQ
jgi:hypothetical protein